jgi:hypothetical protein
MRIVLCTSPQEQGVKISVIKNPDPPEEKTGNWGTGDM